MSVIFICCFILLNENTLIKMSWESLAIWALPILSQPLSLHFLKIKVSGAGWSAQFDKHLTPKQHHEVGRNHCRELPLQRDWVCLHRSCGWWPTSSCFQIRASWSHFSPGWKCEPAYAVRHSGGDSLHIWMFDGKGCLSRSTGLVLVTQCLLRVCCCPLAL